MRKNNAKKFVFIIYFWLALSWVINLIKFINCDFNEPWKEEIIHGIGLFTGIISLITAWL